jgi:hypothetical protein
MYFLLFPLLSFHLSSFTFFLSSYLPYQNFISLRSLVFFFRSPSCSCPLFSSHLCSSTSLSFFSFTFHFHGSCQSHFSLVPLLPQWLPGHLYGRRPVPVSGFALPCQGTCNSTKTQIYAGTDVQSATPLQSPHITSARTL